MLPELSCQPLGFFDAMCFVPWMSQSECTGRGCAGKGQVIPLLIPYAVSQVQEVHHQGISEGWGPSHLEVEMPVLFE